MKPFRTLVFLCGTASLAMLAACDRTPAPQQEPDEAGSEAAAPDAKGGISASDGRMVLSAVPHRPAAVYFSVRNDGPIVTALSGAQVEGAGKAEMHKTEGGSMGAVASIPIQPGATVTFAPGGLHLMVFDPPAALKAGGTTELTLSFSDGARLSMPVRIENIGDDAGAGGMGDMTGMQH